MFGLSAAVRVYLAREPADMRKSFDGLSALVAGALALDPLSGHLFVFLNKRRDRIKILYWDRDGLAVWAKKQEQDYPHCSGFTGIGRHPDNLLGRPAQAGGLDSSPPRCGSRRYSMPRTPELVAPPRARWLSGRRRSINFGAC
jgi:transposase